MNSQVYDKLSRSLKVTNGFLVDSVGRKIVVVYTDATKETITSVSYYDGPTLLYTITATSPNATTDEFERTV